MQIKEINRLWLIIWFALFTACGSGVDGSTDTNSTLQMPSQLGRDLPSTLTSIKAKSCIELFGSSIAMGTGYQSIRDTSDSIANALYRINTVLGFVYRNRYLYDEQINKKVVLTSGRWFYLNTSADNASRKYLYYGESVATTNLYIDWLTGTDNSFSGKALFYFESTNKWTSVVFEFHALDLVLTFRPKSGDNISKTRSRISWKTDGVEVSTRIGYTNIYNPNTVLGTCWVKTTGEGGVKVINFGRSQEVTPNYYGNAVYLSNFTYHEYFDISGSTVWKLCTMNIYRTNDMLWVATNKANISESVTNGTTRPALGSVVDGVATIDDFADFNPVICPFDSDFSTVHLTE